MALPKSGKLVRDRIPEIVARSGGAPVVETLAADEYVEALHLKLAEEAQELRDATPSNRLEELADVFEVLKALTGAYGLSLEDVVTAARYKGQERGGFERRIWMMR